MLRYDAVGRLAWIDAAADTWFLYDGTDVIAEYDGAGTLLRRYVHGPGVDEPIVWYEGSGTSDRRFLLADERTRPAPTNFSYIAFRSRNNIIAGNNDVGNEAHQILCNATIGLPTYFCNVGSPVTGSGFNFGGRVDAGKGIIFRADLGA